ncbi:MAG: hypothetical protein ACE37K_05200 [Planctomycetota bacterium]
MKRPANDLSRPVNPEQALCALLQALGSPLRNLSDLFRPERASYTLVSTCGHSTTASEPRARRFAAGEVVVVRLDGDVRHDGLFRMRVLGEVAEGIVVRAKADCARYRIDQQRRQVLREVIVRRGDVLVLGKDRVRWVDKPAR